MLFRSNDTATTEIYTSSHTLSLHDALPNSPEARRVVFVHLNHTNRLLWDAEAIREIEGKGFSVAREGQRVRLASGGE